MKNEQPDREKEKSFLLPCKYILTFKLTDN